MANELDEITGPVNESGRDVNVIEKQIPVKVGVGSTIFQVVLCLFILPIPFVLLARVNAGKRLSQLQQKIQQAASQVDNYLEQRVMILQNAAQLVTKGMDLDKSTFTEIARLRAGGADNFTETNKALENVGNKINVALENYPDLKAHQELAAAMQQNSYTQREITAAREHYNDVVAEWNKLIFEWPFPMIIAAKRGYTTRIPFSASKETKEQARGTFFN
ncbi:MAG: LemA family protein [Bacilli bacterium]|nr:LemA family protein [Bacilli bacterium]MBR0033953.1 LemA family protein [Bacilli bacterium]MBR0194415.1 LemA family protein [Bacilli bacterium]MBR0301977.1 LemA family protein [Bacilli bacterium]